MSDTAQPAARPPLGRRIRRFMSDRPIVPLIVLLIVLVVILQLLRPGIINERWIANTVKFAIPLAILASCQTLTMLTGGIDLSVGTVATMSAFIVASQVVDASPGGRDADLAHSGRAHRRRERHRGWRVPRSSAHHDARHEPDRHRRVCRSISAPSSPPARKCPHRSPGSAPA